MNAPARRAAPARFDASQQQRRVMLAKVHVARKELGLDEDSYRGVLVQVTGHMSAANCTEGQLVDVLKHFEARGFKTRPRKAGQRPSADHPSARKSRALWISLYHLGAIDHASEKALEAFAARQLKVAALQWADQSQCYKLVEALKAIAERHGWSQDMSGVAAKLDARGKVRLLKLRLCRAILAKLQAKDLAGAQWDLDTAAFRLCGIEFDNASGGPATVEDLDGCARALGAKLREAGL